MGIDPRCLRILDAQEITAPTPVQAQAIPAAIEGRDVLAVAQTGTGKTLAFGLPAIMALADAPRGRTQMLVLAPTRELAQQVHKVIEQLAKPFKLRTACVFGGVGMQPQTDALRRGAEIVIATPGRLIDHLERKNAKLGDVSVLVLDEADRMLDMGFLPPIRQILKGLPKVRQTMFFSATFPKEIQRLVAEFQNDPVRISISPTTKAADSVRQGVYTVDANQKMGLLSDVLRKPGVDSAIVFIRTKHGTERVAKTLQKQGFNAQAIHGGRSQQQRDKALLRFRQGQCNVLVATDVAARGIDVQGVTHVVNFDVPKTFDDYVHRIGRTGRANAAGDAITFISPQDIKEFGAIENGLGRQLPQEEWDGAVKVLSLFKPAQSTVARKGASRRPQRSRRRFAGRR